MRATKKFLDGFENAVNEFRCGENGVIYHELDVTLEEDNHNDWAIVLGWSPVDDISEDELDDFCKQIGYQLAVKIAFQPKNSGMQCDYDVDWLLPYDKQGNGDVEDCEWHLSDGDNFRKVIKDVVADWNKNKKKYIKMVTGE